MELIDAFLLATSWAYFGCLIFTILEKPPMANIKDAHQGIFYAFACIIFMLSSVDVFPQYIYAVLGPVYGFASIGSFLGWPQVWMAYWTSDPEEGSAAEQIGMAFWDLTIALFFFMKFTL